MELSREELVAQQVAKVDGITTEAILHLEQLIVNYGEAIQRITGSKTQAEIDLATLRSGEETVVPVDPEAEEALERLLNDARSAAVNPNPMYEGRVLDEIDDDIELVRAELGVEL